MKKTIKVLATKVVENTSNLKGGTFKPKKAFVTKVKQTDTVLQADEN